MLNEETVFNDAEAREIALDASSGYEKNNVSFRMEERFNRVKSEGGVVRFDRWKDATNQERFTSELTRLGIEFKVVENERDDTIDVKVRGAGRPIYDLVEYIKVSAAGNKLEILDRPVSKKDKIDYARRYAAWKAGQDVKLAGTPLTQWPGLRKSQIEDLANHGVHTVEQLAGIPDETLGRIGPITSLKQRAQDYLKSAQGMAPVSQLRSELAHSKSEVEALKAQMKQLASAMAKEAVATEEKDEAPDAPKRRGRPPKSQEQTHAE